MITDAIFGALFAGLDALLTLLPSWSFPSSVDVGIADFAANLNNVVPIQTAMTVVGAGVALVLGLRLWDLSVFIFHQFWGSD